MKKKLFTVIIIALAAGAATAAFRFFGRSGPDDVLTLYGNVDTRQVTLGFRVGGRIIEINVDEGDRIEPGAVIARLDDAPYRAELNQARAELADAEANLTKLNNGSRPEEIARARAAVKALEAALRNSAAQHDRTAEMVKTRAVSDSEFDKTLAARDQNAAELEFAKAELARQESGFRYEEILAAEAKVKAAKARVESCELKVSDCVLIAPEAGVVQTRIKEPGAIIAAGTGIVTETLDTPVWVRAYVPETLLGIIHTGMPVDIHIDSLPGAPAANGRIGFISPIAEFTPKNVETATLRTDLVYRIRVVAGNGSKRLLQGMPVTLKISETGK